MTLHKRMNWRYIKKLSIFTKIPSIFFLLLCVYVRICVSMVESYKWLDNYTGAVYNSNVLYSAHLKRFRNSNWLICMSPFLLPSPTKAKTFYHLSTTTSTMRCVLYFIFRQFSVSVHWPSAFYISPSFVSVVVVKI